jgi:hypothetical protein
MLVMRIENLFQWPTCNMTGNVHFGHAICHKNVSSRHAIIQAVAHVGHENRGLISMTDMQIWLCIPSFTDVFFFFFESPRNNRTVSSLETVLLFVELTNWPSNLSQRSKNNSPMWDSNSEPLVAQVEDWTTAPLLLKTIAVHNNIYSRKQKGHIVNMHLGGYSVGWVAIWATSNLTKQHTGHLHCKQAIWQAACTVRLHLVYWSHCEHACGWIFRWMTCGFGFRRCGACSLARDCPSQHKMMTHKGANCMPRTCGRKNRKSFNGMCCRLHVPRAAGHAEACPDPFFYCTLNVPQASMHTGTGHAAGCPLAGMSVKD